MLPIVNKMQFKIENNIDKLLDKTTDNEQLTELALRILTELAQNLDQIDTYAIYEKVIKIPESKSKRINQATATMINLVSEVPEEIKEHPAYHGEALIKAAQSLISHNSKTPFCMRNITIEYCKRILENGFYLIRKSSTSIDQVTISLKKDEGVINVPVIKSEKGWHLAKKEKFFPSIQAFIDHYLPKYKPCK